jgi:cytochrome c biogenesis protein CcmG/thiol:disulfide interchange protein DsbE
MPDNQRKPNVLAFALIGIVALALVAVVIGLAAGGDDDDAAAPVDTAEEVAPVVTGETFEGDAITIPGDGPAVIVFLAHWCPHCQEEVPVVQAWIAAGGLPSGVDFVSVATAIDPNAPNYPPDAWLDREGWTAPVIVDPTNSVAQAYGLSAFPFWVFVGPDGTVRARTVGSVPAADLEAMIRDLTGS